MSYSKHSVTEKGLRAEHFTPAIEIWTRQKIIYSNSCNGWTSATSKFFPKMNILIYNKLHIYCDSLNQPLVCVCIVIAVATFRSTVCCLSIWSLWAIPIDRLVSSSYSYHRLPDIGRHSRYGNNRHTTRTTPFVQSLGTNPRQVDVV